MKTYESPIIVEQVFETDITTVWRAITDLELMRQWYFENIPAFEARVGFSTEFTVENEGRTFPHRWRVTEVIPGQRLTYDWSYANYAGDSYVVWELLEAGNSTRLKLTVVVREDFPDNIPEFARESCVAGWDYFIKGRLKAFLDEQKP